MRDIRIPSIPAFERFPCAAFLAPCAVLPLPLTCSRAPASLPFPHRAHSRSLPVCSRAPTYGARGACRDIRATGQPAPCARRSVRGMHASEQPGRSPFRALPRVAAPFAHMCMLPLTCLHPCWPASPSHQTLPFPFKSDIATHTVPAIRERHDVRALCRVSRFRRSQA